MPISHSADREVAIGCAEARRRRLRVREIRTGNRREVEPMNSDQPVEPTKLVLARQGARNVLPDLRDESPKSFPRGGLVLFSGTVGSATEGPFLAHVGEFFGVAHGIEAGDEAVVDALRYYERGRAAARTRPLAFGVSRVSG